MADLWVLPYSPWSEKARWALDHHGLPYRVRVHQPMLGEAGLRLRLRRFGKATVPAYIDGDLRLNDSFAIAEYAEAHGRGAPLFPKDALATIRAWNDRSERVVGAGRVVFLAKTLADDDVKEEMLPPFIPSALRPSLRGLATLGVGFFMSKYGVKDPKKLEAAQLAIVIEELEALRAGLDGRRFLLGDQLSYADLAMAVTLEVVKPVDERFIHLKPAVKRAWTNDAIAERFDDLVRWRDGLYQDFRAPRDPNAVTEASSAEA